MRDYVTIGETVCNDVAEAITETGLTPFEFGGLEAGEFIKALAKRGYKLLPPPQSERAAISRAAAKLEATTTQSNLVNLSHAQKRRAAIREAQQ